MITSVAAALRAFGGRNAGTPLLMASTPVSAVHPEANARSSRTARASPPTAEACSSGIVADSAGGSVPWADRTAATPSRR
jgi:hypothetical protein